MRIKRLGLGMEQEVLLEEVQLVVQSLEVGPLVVVLALVGFDPVER